MKRILCILLSVILLVTVTTPALSISADSVTAYGLSEFIIFKGAQVKGECTYNLEDFAAYAMTQK